MKDAEVEPWLRGTYGELDVVRRAVVHALELAEEDVLRWCEGLGEEAMFARPGGVAPVAFHLRHVVRSLDRLLTYAEGSSLSEGQFVGLQTEMDAGNVAEVMGEFSAGMTRAKGRVLGFSPGMYEEVRFVGRGRVASTVGGLLIHCAEHTSRHVGQVVTLVGVLREGRG